MFGMSLRAYHAKVRRLADNQDERHRSLWQSIAGFFETKGTVSRADLLHRFRHDDQMSVIGIVNDLVSNGWVFRKGDGANTMYRIAEASDIMTEDNGDESTLSLVWIIIRRHGPLERRSLAHCYPL